ncbi:IGR protein motif-domain-containing protein [Aspergillus filifer]
MAMHSPFSITRTVRSFQLTRQCLRTIHKKSLPTSSVPSPTSFVPDVQTFLTLIGRDMSKHSSKIPSWEKLFTFTSAELRDAGIEPARQRRYLLRKREKFRNGIYGPGGDLETVVDGAAQLRVTEVPLTASERASNAQNGAATNLLGYSATLTPGMKRVIVNLPPDATEYKHDASKPLRKFAQMKIHRGLLVKGPYLQPIKGTDGSAAIIKVQEGMWEDKLGHKVDGGERRRAEVRHKMRAEERRKGSA